MAICCAILLLGYAFLPVLGLFLGLRGAEGIHWLTVFESTRARDLLFDSFRIAVFAGSFASVLGFVFASILKRMPHVLCNSVAGILLLLHLSSPYLLAQSFIALLGEKGIAWQAFGIKPFFSIYTVSGVIAVATVWLAPLAMLVHLSANGLPQAYFNELKTLNVSRLKWIRYYVLPANGTAFLLSFGLCGLIAFWNYDLASMLRVNVFPIDIMAAFGSFYDYGMALELFLFPGLGSLGLLVLLIGCATRNLWGHDVRERRTRSESGAGVTALQGVLLASVLVVYVALFVSLWNTIGSYDVFVTEISKFKNEWTNTIRYGMCGTFVVCFITFLMSITGQLSGDKISQKIAFCTVFIWLFPPVLLGMGWINLWDLPLLKIGRNLGIEMYLISIHSASAIVPALVVAMSLKWHRSNNEVLDGVRCPLRIRALLFLNCQRSLIGILLFVGFANVAREVAAGLLNVPPDGSTLALSIETLLHFEQPVRVASLCLAYFLTILICCGIFWLFGMVFDRLNKLLLHRNLKV